ncbi:MAG: hypothetical protein JWO13_2769 [Acidobacteriales bacterium]|nr:hypothetical protein [Terriglobales bacterium]
MQDMNNDRKQKMLDDLLDGALAEYSNVEPRAGLEHRIVAGLAGREQGKWRGWKWTAAFAAACVLIVAMFVAREMTAPQMIVTKTPEVKKDSLPGITIAKNPIALAHDRSLEQAQRTKPKATPPHESQKRSTVAKQQTFPAAAPLSEQERLLFAYLRRTPREEIVKNSKPDEPKVELEMNQAVPGAVRDTDRNTNLR